MLDDTRRALNNLTGEVSGRLVLATSHHIGLHRLPPLLRAFTRAHPQVALDISSWIRKWPTRRSFMVVRNWR